MRVLFTTLAMAPHYYPMVPQAWALRAAGHEVRMTSQPELLPAMRSSGLPVTAVGSDVDTASMLRAAMEEARLAGPAAVRPPSRSTRLSTHLSGIGAASPAATDAYRSLCEFEDETIAMHQAHWRRSSLAEPWRRSVYGEVAMAMVDDLLALARSWQPDLIVFDPLTFAGPVVAKLIGVPAVRSLFGPDATYFMTTTGISELLDKYGLDDVDLHGVATVDPCPPSLQYPDAVAPARRLRTRYVPYGGISEVPAWLPHTPERPRICLTWGTSIHRLLGDRAFLPGEVLLGCAKLADERGADLVLAITASQRQLLPDLPSNVEVVESVPLDALLPSCDAVIHQGGAGTMLTALRHGLPQLILTQVLDQAANALALLSAGAGQTRPAAGLAASDLLTTGHDLLDDPRYREAAKRIQQEILDQPTPAEIVGKLVNLLVH